MNPISANALSIVYAAVASLLVAGGGALNYYGYAILGQTASRTQPGYQTHYYNHFHK